MSKIVIHLNDEELTKYFEDPEKFEFAHLCTYFHNIDEIEFGNWVDKDNNVLELIIKSEIPQSELDAQAREYYGYYL